MPKPSLPVVTSDIPRDLRLWLDRAREALTAMVATRSDLE